MTFSEDPKPVTPGYRDANAEPTWPDVHPRIRARIKTVQLTERKQRLLILFDRLIDGLSTLSERSDHVKALARTARDLRVRLEWMAVDDPGLLALVGQIQQYMKTLSTDLAEMLGVLLPI